MSPQNIVGVHTRIVIKRKFLLAHMPTACPQKCEMFALNIHPVYHDVSLCAHLTNTYTWSQNTYQFLQQNNTCNMEYLMHPKKYHRTKTTNTNN